MSTRRQISVTQDLQERLTVLAQIHKIPVPELIAYFMDLNDVHNFLEADWIEKLTEDALRLELQKKDPEFAKKIELERAKTINKAKFEAFRQYIAVLDPENRKIFLENVLGNVNDETFIESISNFQIYNVDGTNRLYQVDEDGKPKIPGTNPENIVSCLMGYHIQGGFCKCNKWRDCGLRSQEYLTYLSKSDPNMKREETRRFATNYKGDKNYR